MLGTRSDSECVSYTRVWMPSFAPTAFRPPFASWLNERSCRLPMSVTIAILNAPVAGFVDVVVLLVDLLSLPQPATSAHAPASRIARPTTKCLQLPCRIVKQEPATG